MWLVTDKGDQDARVVADRHYARQTPGAPQFCRNGQNLVFITPALDAVWVTHRPAPGRAHRPDGLDAWECTLFRNEAVLCTVAFWGPIPADGLLTYVDPEKVRGEVAGYCFRRAGWKRRGTSRDGKPRFIAPRPRAIPDRSACVALRARGGSSGVTSRGCASARCSQGAWHEEHGEGRARARARRNRDAA